MLALNPLSRSGPHVFGHRPTHLSRWISAALLGLASVASNPARAQEPGSYPPGPRLERVKRVIDQRRVPFEQSRDHQKCWLYWQVDYVLRNAGPEPIEIHPETVSAEIDGFVSNARAFGHEIPKRLAHGLASDGRAGTLQLESDARLIASTDEAQACLEHATLILMPDRAPAPIRVSPRPIAEVSFSARRAPDQDPAEPEPAPEPNTDAAMAPAVPFLLSPGEDLRVRLRLEHRHFLHGPFDPLLGRRELTLRVGPATFRDELPMQAPLADVFPPSNWPDPPADRLDPRVYLSAPDSLHLSAAIAGHHSFDYPERPVRYDTPMRLRFSYLRAPGLDGDCTAELKQYRDAPRSYRALSEAHVRIPLDVEGRWVHVDRIVRTDSQATTVRLRFLIDTEFDFGDVWIDNIAFEPCEEVAENP